MLYNAQASEPAVQRLVQMAKDNENPGRRRLRDRAAGRHLSAVDARPARRARQGARRRGQVSALRFDEVTIRLGGRDILAAVSFVVEDGEFIGMLGANGAGKTTLMRAALGLTPVASGAISVLDRPVTRGNVAIGYMPQNRGVVAGLRLTGYDIVASAAIGARFGFAAPRQGDATRNRLGARSGRRARPRAPLDQRTLGRRAPAPAAEPGAARPARSCCCSTSR